MKSCIVFIFFCFTFNFCQAQNINISNGNEFDFELYPNPSSANIELAGEEIDKVQIIDALGRLVFKMENINQDKI